MAIAFKRRTSLPEIVAPSEAFQAGYDKAQRNQEHTGWPTSLVAQEATIIEFLSIVVEMVSADLATGDDCTYELQWISGLLTGWLRRES